MDTEIFRFSIVRNPQRITSDQYKKSVIDLVSEETGQHPFYNALKELRNAGAERESILKTAKRFLIDNNFISNLDQLNTPLLEFGEWLESQEKPSVDIIKTKTDELFGAPVADLVKKTEFKNDKIKVSDSLVVASIIKPPKSGNRGDLMRARRVIFLLEYLANSENEPIDVKTIRRILSATILLPAELFPIPDNNDKRREENKKAYDKRVEDIEKEKARIKEISDKLQQA